MLSMTIAENQIIKIAENIIVFWTYDRKRRKIRIHVKAPKYITIERTDILMKPELTIEDLK